MVCHTSYKIASKKGNILKLDMDSKLPSNSVLCESQIHLQTLLGSYFDEQNDKNHFVVQMIEMHASTRMKKNRSLKFSLESWNCTERN